MAVENIVRKFKTQFVAFHLYLSLVDTLMQNLIKFGIVLVYYLKVMTVTMLRLRGR